MYLNLWNAFNYCLCLAVCHIPYICLHVEVIKHVVQYPVCSLILHVAACAWLVPREYCSWPRNNKEKFPRDHQIRFSRACHNTTCYSDFYRHCHSHTLSVPLYHNLCIHRYTHLPIYLAFLFSLLISGFLTNIGTTSRKVCRTYKHMRTVPSPSHPYCRICTANKRMVVIALRHARWGKFKLIRWQPKLSHPGISLQRGL